LGRRFEEKEEHCPSFQGRKKKKRSAGATKLETGRGKKKNPILLRVRGGRRGKKKEKRKPLLWGKGAGILLREKRKGRARYMSTSRSNQIGILGKMPVSLFR